jgi:hypothetical protein
MSDGVSDCGNWTGQRSSESVHTSPKDGWTKVRTSFYNELLQSHTEYQILLQEISDEYNLLDSVCMLSVCHHKQCVWRRSIHTRTLAALRGEI